MGIKVFERIDGFDDPFGKPPEAPEGMWAIICPGCSSRWQRPGCDTCIHSELGVPGWVLVEAIETIEPCRIGDHTWTVTLESGGSVIVECVDPHTPVEQEAMYRHRDRRIPPGCVQDDELRDMMAGTFRVKFEIVVEGGSYEYPNDVDVWAEITEAELVK